jgi:hypothetical protein
MLGMIVSGLAGFQYCLLAPLTRQTACFPSFAIVAHRKLQNKKKVAGKYEIISLTLTLAPLAQQVGRQAGRWAQATGLADRQAGMPAGGQAGTTVTCCNSLQWGLISCHFCLALCPPVQL